MSQHEEKSTPRGPHERHGHIVHSDATAYGVQLPATHSSSTAQRLPQPPQFRGSVRSSTQRLPHVRVPAGQVATQAPRAHRGVPPPHVVPHAPQLAGSLRVFTQPAPQSVRPGRHSHTPPAQASSSAQVVPQSPQRVGSFAKSKHSAPAPGHACVPAAQVHAPETQTSVPPQRTPQPPQLSGSALGSRHLPPHAMSPAIGHTQPPEMHIVPAGQLLPHAPQFRASLETSLQTPPQFT